MEKSYVIKDNNFYKVNCYYFVMELQNVRQAREKSSIPRGSDLVVAGDVSATNTFLGIYAKAKGNVGDVIPVVEVLYDGQEIKGGKGDPEVFNKLVLEDLLARGGVSAEDISRGVLCPACPTKDGKGDMSNADFSLDGNTIPFDVAMMNDFRAKGYGVSHWLSVLPGRPDLKTFRLRHVGKGFGLFVPKMPIEIPGPGTGYGNTRLFFDESTKLYLPKDSEGGHVALQARNSEELEVCEYLKEHFCEGHWPIMEDAVSGRGIPNVFEAFAALRDLDYPGVRGAEDKAAYIARTAKQDIRAGNVTAFTKAFDFVWTSFGRSIRDKVVHEGDKGGFVGAVYCSGGAFNKDIQTRPGSGVSDEYVEELVMKAFDDGSTHRVELRKTPINVVLNDNLGSMGCLSVMFNEQYRDNEKFY